MLASNLFLYLMASLLILKGESWSNAKKREKRHVLYLLLGAVMLMMSLFQAEADLKAAQAKEGEDHNQEDVNKFTKRLVRVTKGGFPLV